jgi:transcriptional regulator with XRE-family HTH domain
VAHIIYTYKGRVLNLSALAEKLTALGLAGGSVSNLSRVFSGRHRPRLDLSLAMAKIFGITAEEIPDMLAHCKSQRESWKYAPTWGRTRPPLPRGGPSTSKEKKGKKAGGDP